MLFVWMVQIMLVRVIDNVFWWTMIVHFNQILIVRSHSKEFPLQLNKFILLLNRLGTHLKGHFDRKEMGLLPFIALIRTYNTIFYIIWTAVSSACLFSDRHFLFVCLTSFDSQHLLHTYYVRLFLFFICIWTLNIFDISLCFSSYIYLNSFVFINYLVIPPLNNKQWRRSWRRENSHLQICPHQTIRVSFFVSVCCYCELFLYMCSVSRHCSHFIRYNFYDWFNLIF